MKKIKSLIILPNTIALAISTISMSSCSKFNIDSLAETLKQEAVNIFINNISPIYRETFQTRKIADYIKSWVNKLGFSVYEDDYRSEEVSIEKSSGNIWFDIPATKGCENLEGVTLQAHLDMVCAEADKKSNPYDWSQGVIAVIDGNKIHSKDYRTSLGADDGIGLSMCLAIAKNESKFKHGPIRVLMTSDEEDGVSGASNLNKDTIKYNKIINIDGANVDEACISCAGTFEIKFSFDVDFEPVDTTQYNEYLLSIRGLLGGHSANEINNNRACAIKLAAEVLMKTGCEPLIQSFVSTDANNNIASSANIIFYTKNKISDESFKSIVTQQKAKFPNETKMEINLLEPNNKNADKNALNTQNSQKILNMVSNLKYGVNTWLDEKKTQVASSGNIGPFNLSVNQPVKFCCLTRSCIDEQYNDIINQNVNAVKNEFGEEAAKYIFIKTPAWDYKENNKLFNIAADGAKQQNITLKKASCHGWLECAYINDCNPTSEIISLGANVIDEHGINGEVEISSIKQLARTVIFTLMNIDKK